MSASTESLPLEHKADQRGAPTIAKLDNSQGLAAALKEQVRLVLLQLADNASVWGILLELLSKVQHLLEAVDIEQRGGRGKRGGRERECVSA